MRAWTRASFSSIRHRGGGSLTWTAGLQTTSCDQFDRRIMIFSHEIICGVKHSHWNQSQRWRGERGCDGVGYIGQDRPWEVAKKANWKGATRDKKKQRWVYGETFNWSNSQGLEPGECPPPQYLVYRLQKFGFAHVFGCSSVHGSFPSTLILRLA